MDTKDAAVRLAREGFRIFPLRPNSKIPPEGFLWKALATTDPAIAERWWGGEYAGHNIGVATGRGLLVADFDMKPGQRGAESLGMLDMLGLPESLRVRTPTGGVHVYLRVPEQIDITISAGRIPDYPDVDVRCEGGYVVGPGSSIDGVPYERT